MNTLQCLLQVPDQNPEPPKTVESMTAAGKWMECRDLVQLLHRARVQSQTVWHQTHSLTQARAVHDAVLGCVVFTHLPPMRLSCIRSMLAPDCTAPCSHPDCKLKDCEGNKLYVDSTSPLRLRMKFPHHKNESKWKRAVIEFVVPAELAELLHVYLEGPRRALMDRLLGLGNSCDCVFMNSRGQPFSSSSNFTTYWQQYMVSRGGPALNPSNCRQIFVVERMSDGAAAGPSDRGAAMIMGHSTKQWLDKYDVMFHPRLAQKAVDAMPVWTADMLQQPCGAAQPSGQRRLTRRHAQIILSDSSDSDCEQPALAMACQATQEIHDSDEEFMSCSSAADSDIEVVLE